MTRGEIIKWLESLKAEISKSEHRTLWHYAESIDIAIKALSVDGRPLKQVDTLIIADALRYLIDDEERNELDRKRAEQLRQEVLEYGASMCSDYRQKGTWISQDHNKSNGMATTAAFYAPICSECGATGNFTDNFCANCGADMRGEKDD